MVKAKRVYLKKVVKSLTPITKLKTKELINIIPLLTDDCIHKVCESCQKNIILIGIHYQLSVVMVIYRERKTFECVLTYLDQHTYSHVEKQFQYCLLQIVAGDDVHCVFLVEM